MAAAVPVKFDLKTGSAVEMRGVGTRPGDAAFDSSLIFHNGVCENHTLTLVLKIHLDPLLPPSAPLPPWFRLPFPDSDNKFFLLRPWNPGEFATFTRKFKQQCALWNNHFWLQPPGDFSRLDIKSGHQTIRPNIYCHLFVDIVGGPAQAHRTITVVSLAKTPGLPDPGKFRSDSELYSSLDTGQSTYHKRDDKGKPHTLNQYTITHEIGHALGLPHIGVTRGDPSCQFAMVLDEHLPANFNDHGLLPAIFKGGSNSDVCYGTFAPPNRGANVMGFGSCFDETNARPWVDRIALHTGTKPEAWKVFLKRIAPKFV